LLFARCASHFVGDLETSGNASAGTEKLGVVPMLEKIFSFESNKMDIVLNEQKQFYMVYAVSDGVVNGRMMETNDIKEFIFLLNLSR